MKRLAIFFTTTLVMSVALGTAALAGNGAPSGSHYNLNIIGVPRDKTADMTGTSGHTIFVDLDGPTKILLCESGVDAACADVSGFEVLDRNGTDGTAVFALPNPLSEQGCTDIFDPDTGELIDTVCVTAYSVFARAPGNRGGSANLTTCAEDPSDGSTVCSVQVFEITQSSKFSNVTKYLLFVFWDTDGDGVADKLVPIFSDELQDYYWQYDNNGLKLLQLRFYGCSTSVSLTGRLDSSDCVLTGN